MIPNLSDHDLKQRSLRGLSVTLAAQALKFGLQSASIMVMARLLAKSDFGLVAMVTSITGFIVLFTNAGLSAATVQRNTITQEQISNLFWLNVLLSSIATFAALACAPLLAKFYGKPQLTGIASALVLPILLNGLAAQHQALLRRGMRFRALATVDLSSLACGLGVGIVLAWRGFSYWALVAQTCTTAAASCALMWILSPWRPSRPRPGAGIRKMVRFGGALSAAALFNYVREHCPSVSIGYSLGDGPLALYDRAQRLLTLPVSQMLAPLSAVAIPALSRMQHNHEQLRRVVQHLVLFAYTVTLPISLVALLLAPELVQLALGRQFADSARIFAMLAPLAAMQVISSISIWVLTVCGKGGALLRFSMQNAALALMSIAVGLQHSLEAGVLSYMLTGVLVRTPLLYRSVVHHTPVTWGDLFGRVWPLTAGGIVLGVVGLTIRWKLVGFDTPSPVWAISVLVAIASLSLFTARHFHLLDIIKRLRLSTRAPS